MYPFSKLYPLAHWYWKRKKMFLGAYRTYLKNEKIKYDPAAWFDRHYEGGISDRQTIGRWTNLYIGCYHYASIEMLILRELYHSNFDMDGSLVFDVGSGAGRWLKFYKTLGAGRCIGIDISTVATNYLSETLTAEDIEIHNGSFQEFLANDGRQYDLINAIGVMFHVVDDLEWLKGVKQIANSLKNGGLLIVGGHFGLFNNINVQYDREGRAWKRLRSRTHWKKTLCSLGFRKVKVRRNLGYLLIDGYVPESNILFAWK